VQIHQAIDKQTQHLEIFSRGFEELSNKITSGNIQDQTSHGYHADGQEIGPKLHEIRDQSSTIQETVHETSQQLSAVVSQNSSILSSLTRLLFIITSGILTLHSLRRKVAELIQSWSAFTAEMRDFTKQRLWVDFPVHNSRADGNFPDKYLGKYTRLLGPLKEDCHQVFCYRVFSSKMHGEALFMCRCRYFRTSRLVYATRELESY
jgi:hypothetical protein